jgi:hypothetical protein
VRGGAEVDGAIDAGVRTGTDVVVLVRGIGVVVLPNLTVGWAAGVDVDGSRVTEARAEGVDRFGGGGGEKGVAEYRVSCLGFDGEAIVA